MEPDTAWTERAARISGFIAWATEPHKGMRYAVRDRKPFPGVGWLLVSLGGRSADIESQGAFYDDDTGTAAEHCAAGARKHQAKFTAARKRARPKTLRQ